MKLSKTLILPGLILSILIIIYIYTLSGIEQNSAIYRPDSYTPYGLKGLQLFLIKHRYSLHPAARLQRDSGACLVITGRNSQSDQVYHDVSNWIHDGGILIELAESKPLFSRKNSFRSISPMTTSNSEDPAFEDLQYNLKHRLPFVTSTNQVHGIYGTNRRYFIYGEPFGKGTIISWNDPDGLVNQNLQLTPDHAAIFLRLIQERIRSGPITVLDLRYLHHTSGSPLKNIFNRHAAAIFLIIAGMIMSLWKLSFRFGRPRPLSLIKGRSRNEFAIFLAALFQQAGAREMVIDNLYRALLQTILEITIQPPNTLADPAIRSLETLTGKDYSLLRRITESIETRQIYQTLSRKSFLPLASKIDRYRKELEIWKKSRISVMK